MSGLFLGPRAEAGDRPGEPITDSGALLGALLPPAGAFPSLFCAPERFSVEGVDDPCSDGTPEAPIRQNGVHPLCKEHGVGEGVGVAWRVRSQPPLLVGSQTESKANAEFGQEQIDFALGERAQPHLSIQAAWLQRRTPIRASAVEWAVVFLVNGVPMFCARDGPVETTPGKWV